MKLICFPFQSRHFYLKPETALLRNGRTFYTPENSSRIECALALVVKIDRLGRHIAPPFAHRYYHETALGFCLYAADILEECRMHGVSWASACALDYSAPLSERFTPLLQSERLQDLFAWEQWSGYFTESIDEAIAHLSRTIFLKMGDLIWFELHPPLLLSPPSQVHASRNGQIELHFGIR